MKARIKHMNIIALSEALVLSKQASMIKSASDRLFGIAIAKFQESIRSMPNNKQALETFASALIQRVI